MCTVEMLDKNLLLKDWNLKMRKSEKCKLKWIGGGFGNVVEWVERLKLRKIQ